MTHKLVWKGERAYSGDRTYSFERSRHHQEKRLTLFMRDESLDWELGGFIFTDVPNIEAGKALAEEWESMDLVYDEQLDDCKRVAKGAPPITKPAGRNDHHDDPPAPSACRRPT